MKKWNYHLPFAIVCGLCGLLLAALICLRIWDVVVWIGFATTYELLFYFKCVLLLLLPIWLAVWLWHLVKAKWVRCVVIVLLILVLLFGVLYFGVTYLADYALTEYAVYTSPDGEHTVVVQTCSFSVLEWGTVYEKTSAITLREIGDFEWKYGGRYTVSWEGDQVVIACGERKFPCDLLED